MMIMSHNYNRFSWILLALLAIGLLKSITADPIGHSSDIHNEKVARRKREDNEVSEGLKNGAEFGTKILEGFKAANEMQPPWKVGSIVKGIGNFAGLLGPALGAVGVAFSIIGSFFPQKSDELRAIEEGFELMQQGFRQLRSQIDQLGEKLEYFDVLRDYKDIRANMESVDDDYEKVINKSSSVPRKMEFNRTCKNGAIEPSQALKRLHKMIVRQDLPKQAHIASTIAKQYNLEYGTIMAYFHRIIDDANHLATMRMACFGIMFPTATQEDIEDEKKLTSSRVIEIIDVLAKFEANITSIAPDYIKQFKFDLQSIMDNPPDNDTAFEQLKAACAPDKMSKFSPEEKGYNPEFCYGHVELRTRQSALHSYLTNKYPWLKFGIAVRIRRDPAIRNQHQADNFHCPIGQDKLDVHFVFLTSGKYDAFITWSKAHPDLEALALRAQKALRRAGVGEKNVNWDNHLKEARKDITRALDKFPNNQLLYCTFEYGNSCSGSPVAATLPPIGTYGSYRFDLAAASHCKMWVFDIITFYNFEDLTQYYEVGRDGREQLRSTTKKPSE